MGKILRSAACAVMAAVLLVSTEALAAMPDSLVPMGDVTGISIAARGAVVIGVSPIETDGKTVSPAGDAGILPGDVIIRVNSGEISSAGELKAALNDAGGEEITVLVDRAGEKKQFTVTAHKAEDGSGELGVWLRDTLTGIGTITFYDPTTGVFGALGHPVSDTDTGVLFPLREGVIMEAEVTGAVAGKSGEPGQLCGDIDFSQVSGIVTKNTDVGIYGNSKQLEYSGREFFPVADENEIRVGPVTVLSGALGDVQEFSAEILRVYSGEGSRDMMIKITDERLLETTGGIVQGMSGSPIIQGGKLIGAVTHVLVNDPTRGYGVSIEDMLDAAA